LNVLAGFQVVDLSVNVPGPSASARLRDLGAGVTKVEPPGGDPLRRHSAPWYDHLSSGKTVEVLDLKSAPGRDRLDELLLSADLLLTSSRSRVLVRLGLDWPVLHGRFPRLCHVAIVGRLSPFADEPGHDLTYQGAHGLLSLPAELSADVELPRSLLADLHGAEQAASSGLALLLHRERTGAAAFAEVSLENSAGALAASLHFGLTRPGAFLGGGYAPYNVYACSDGWIAIAALEPAFWARFIEAVDRPDWQDAGSVDPREVAALFRSRSRAAWLDLAAAHDIPLSAPIDIAR
jgi:alpha-methylacyl-CoA racemase